MKLYRKLIFAAAVAALSTTGALAQNYTYVAQNGKTVATGGIAPDGTPFGGQFLTGSQTVTAAGGKMVTESYTCIGTTQPPRDSVFMFNSICDATGPNGDYSVVWGCNFLNRERTNLSCVGGLVGKTGSYASRRGTVTYHGVDGKGSGTGQWIN